MLFILFLNYMLDGGLKLLLSWTIQKYAPWAVFYHESPRAKVIRNRGIDRMMGMDRARPTMVTASKIEKEEEEDDDVVVSVQVKVINTSREPRTFHRVPTFAFENNEMDEHTLYVKAINADEDKKLGGQGTYTEVCCNQYKDKWDNIPEFALGTLTFKLPSHGCVDHTRHVELQWDDARNRFVV